MLESIYVGMTGLMGYSQGLRVIANNTANMNTPGFKSSTAQFTDLFYATNQASGSATRQLGYGMTAFATSLNFAQGELRQTGELLDLAIDGPGFFTLQQSDGTLTHTRAGQFEFNADGVLINRVDKAKVMGSANGSDAAEISIVGLRTNPAGASTDVKFTGNLSSTVTEQTVSNVKVVDHNGVEHTLSLKFTNNNANHGNWTVELFDGSTSAGKATLAFVDGKPTAETAKLSFTYTPPGQDDMPLVMDFSQDVTSFASGNSSTLAATGHNGRAAGTASSITFDENGYLTIAYSNGQTARGTRLLLGQFDSADAITAVGSNQFKVTNTEAWHTGFPDAGAFGTIQSGVIELSNVDLSQEFSDLVILQRGYQASSQVVSTANDMLQELFNMKKST